MSMFNEVKLTWAGVAYIIPANRVMGAIAAVEEVVTIADLAAFARTNKVPLARLSMAYGNLLRYAGAPVDDSEVYAGLFESGEQAHTTALAIGSLLQMMVPKTAVKVTPAGNPPEAAPKTVASSRKRTKRQSD